MHVLTGFYFFSGQEFYKIGLCGGKNSCSFDMLSDSTGG